MTRMQLLIKASERPAADVTALDLAQRLLSASDVRQARETLDISFQQLERNLNWCFRATLGSIMAFVAVVMGMTLFTRSDEISPFVLNGALILAFLFIAAFVGCCFGLQHINRKLKLQRHQLRLVQPIAGTHACQMALGYLSKGYPSVTAWRDSAVADREELSLFDVEVLRCLHDMTEQTISVQARQKANEEACRKVHGLQPI